MTPQELRNSILQLAIQGKLVEQRPEEGSGEELYRQIQTEKQRLIKPGTIKKEKSLPDVSKDEIPFDIPDSWKWVRIGQIFGLQAGKNVISSHIHDEASPAHPYICYGGNGIRGYVSSYNRQGHFPIIGRQGALCGNINIAKGQFYATEHAVVVDHYNLTDVIWSSYFLKAINLNQYATATAQPGLAVSNIIRVLIPLPPLAEQKRIVAKIEELLPYIDRYEQAWSKLEDFNKRFPADMQKALLQMAIQGRLVEQRPEEGTGDELYRKIQAEKQRRIKDGTTKKEKPLSDITDDEIPFDIPDSWKWVRLGSVCTIARGGSPRPIKEYLTTAENGINWIKIGDTEKSGKYICSTREKIKPSGVSKSRMVHAGDFLLTNSMSFGRPYILKIDGCIHDGWLVISQTTEIFDQDYLYWLLSSSYAYIQFCGVVSGAVVKNLNSDKVANSIFPLPPLAEQKRIVAKLEELLPLCEKLK